MKKKTSNSGKNSDKKHGKSDKRSDPGLNKKTKVKKNEKQNNEGEEFPGYPHYPPKEDLLNPHMNVERAPIEVEDISSSGIAQGPLVKKSNSPEKQPEVPPLSLDLDDDDLEIVLGSEADLTPEDLQLLGSDELSADLGEDEELKARIFPLDMAASDLDVPGAELDDANEELGEEDEENNPYSIGGDRHEDLEEESDPGR